jgi:uncharacterized protein involved in exopolysaccharide biosynthesis
MSTQPSLPIGLTFLRDRAALRRIAAITVLVSAAGAVYAFLAPKWYRSELVVVPGKAQKSGGLSGLLGGELGGLAAGFESSLGAGADSARIAAVLRSNAVSDAVVDRFDLMTRYEAKYRETAREILWQHCTVKPVPKPNLVELSCEDKDPRFVQELLAYFAEHGNIVFRRVNVSSATEEVKFLEKRVADLRQQADASATRMREFQEQHQIVDLDSQAKALVTAVASLHGQRINRQMELDYAQSFSAPGEASSQQIRSQIAVMDDMLRDLEAPRVAVRSGGAQGEPSRKGAGMFPPAQAVPRLKAEFEQLYRDRKVAEATLLFALERLEGAKANEARDVSTFQVLGPPPLPTRKARPSRLLIIAIAGALGLGGSVGLEWWKAAGRPSLGAMLGGRAPPGNTP